MLDGQIGPDWRDVLQRAGIRVLHRVIVPAGWIATTSCCATKPVPRGTPQQLYAGAKNVLFYKLCRTSGLPFAVLSDAYGIHFPDEVLDYYDTHPSSLSPEDFTRLGGLIREKCAARNVRGAVLVMTSPVRARPYLRMLLASGLELAYCTRYTG